MSLSAILKNYCDERSSRWYERSALSTSQASESLDASVDPNGAAKPVSYEGLLTREAEAQKPSHIVSLVLASMGKPDVIGMHGGLPPNEAFIITNAKLHLSTGDEVAISDPALLAAAQQYNMSFDGYIPLHKWIVEFVTTLHNPPRPTTCFLTTGATHGVYAVCGALVRQGDTVLVEEYCYPRFMDCARMRGATLVGVKMDEEGLVPSHLRELMQDACKREAAGGPRAPRVVYVVPTGQNPTSTCMSLRRKTEVYQYPGAAAANPASPPGDDDPVTVPGLQLPPSFLSLDVDGRVLRIDTFSKVLGPGFRVGWITGPAELVDALRLMCNCNTAGPSSWSQVTLMEAIKSLGRDKLEGFIKDTQALYACKARTVVCAAAEQWEGLVEWLVPEAGMFMWCRVKGVADLDELWPFLVEEKVVVIPGKGFMPASQDAAAAAHIAACPYFRLSFSTMTHDQLREGVARVRRAILALRAAKAAAPPS